MFNQVLLEKWVHKFFSFVCSEANLYTLGLLLAVFLAEHIFVNFQHSSLNRNFQFSNSTKSDFFCFVLNFFKIDYFLEILFTFGAIHYILKLKIFTLNLLPVNSALKIVISFILLDFIRYWMHRIFHKFDVLWQLHGYHHSAEEMSVFTFFRHHFLENIVARLLFLFVNFFLGGNVLSYLVIRLLVYFIEMLQHSNIKSDWGMIGKYILVSPASHRIHHSKNENHSDKNFGNVFIFWDKIFNTYHSPIEIPEIGLKNNIYNKSTFVNDLLLVIKQFFNSLINLK